MEIQETEAKYYKTLEDIEKVSGKEDWALELGRGEMKVWKWVKVLLGSSEDSEVTQK